MTGDEQQSTDLVVFIAGVVLHLEHVQLLQLQLVLRGAQQSELLGELRPLPGALLEMLARSTHKHVHVHTFP